MDEVKSFLSIVSEPAGLDEESRDQRTDSSSLLRSLTSRALGDAVHSSTRALALDFGYTLVQYGCACIVACEQWLGFRHPRLRLLHLHEKRRGKQQGSTRLTLSKASFSSGSKERWGGGWRGGGRSCRRLVYTRCRGLRRVRNGSSRTRFCLVLLPFSSSSSSSSSSPSAPPTYPIPPSF